ncbi:glycosyltransferase family 4 protein [Desulfobacterales bacterium]|nr:glycosyltransferase family 4 protein [Desulfobacterales bacterium]
MINSTIKKLSGIILKSKTTTKTHICFISKSIHYVLHNNTKCLVGGAEIQQKYLASNLIEKGWRVSFLTERTGNERKISLHSNMTIYHKIEYSKGNKFSRKLIYLPKSLWKALKEINADILYQRNPDYLSGILAIYCKLYKKKLIIAGANNWNFEKGKEKNLNNIVDKVCARIGIRFADTIILQNSEQKRLLRKNYNKSGPVFYNIFPERKIRQDSRYVLWVARLESYKRPECFLQIAKNLPEYTFVMVGGHGNDSTLSEKIKHEASQIKNVKYMGHQSFDRVEKLFDEAALFVNTSKLGCEGFPNTFLQAWSRGIPVISFFDPDGLISQYNLGKAVKSISQMQDAIRSSVCKSKDIASTSRKIQSAFIKYFSISTQSKKFINILNM